jgi:O-antigen/teichoic acid export membrane protein
VKLSAHTAAPGGSTTTGRTLGQVAVGGMLWMSLGVIGQVLVQILVLVVLARQVSPQDFGVAAAALVVLAFSFVFADSGFGPALVQRKDLRPEHIRVALTTSVLFGLVVWSLLIFGVVFLLRGLTVGDHLLQRELEYRRLTAVELTALILGYGAVSITLAVTGAGVWSIVWGYVAQAGLRTALLWCVKPHPWLPSLARKPFGELVRFGAMLTVAQVASLVARQGDNFIVGRWLGPAALGLYGRAYQLMSLPALLFGQIANRVLFPTMAAVQDDTARLRKAYSTGVAVIAVLTLPMSMIVAATAREVILIVLGADWLPLLNAFNVLVFCMVFRTGYKIGDCLALATGAVHRRASRQWAYATFVVVGSLVGQRWGLLGVATAVGVALALNYLMMAQLSLSLVDMSWRRFVRAHGAAIALAIIVAPVAWPTAGLLRGAGVPSAVVLAGTLSASAAMVVAAIRAAPRIPGMRPTVESVEDVRALLGPGTARARLDRLTGWRRGAHEVGER